MAQEGKEEVSALLARFSFLVIYTPLADEVALPSLSVMTYHIQPEAELDPKTEVESAIEAAANLPTAILIPGRAFDILGTRHGRGGGWYDRFLAAVPSSWTRIGFCSEKQFSKEALVRQSWDEPVDYVVVQKKGGYEVHETRART